MLIYLMGIWASIIGEDQKSRPPASAAPVPIETWDDVAEYYLSQAVTTMLRLGLEYHPNGKTVVVGRDIQLAKLDQSRYSSVDAEIINVESLGVAMSTLADVYARKERYDLAAPLAIQSLSVLLPANATEQPPVQKRCEGKQPARCDRD